MCREAVAELRRSRFSSLLPCSGEDLVGTNQPKFVQTEEEAACPHCQGQRGHPGVPSSSLTCAWLSKRHVSVLLCTSLSTSGPSGTAEMVRDAQWEMH